MGSLSNLVSPLILYDMEKKCDNIIMHTLYSAWHIVGASQVISDGKTHHHHNGNIHGIWRYLFGFENNFCVGNHFVSYSRLTHSGSGNIHFIAAYAKVMNALGIVNMNAIKIWLSHEKFSQNSLSFCIGK